MEITCFIVMLSRAPLHWERDDRICPHPLPDIPNNFHMVLIYELKLTVPY